MNEQEFHDGFSERILLYGELRKYLEDSINATIYGIKHIDRVAFRIKSRESMREKVFKRKVGQYTNPFVEVEDQIAGRIIVFFNSDIDIVKNRILDRFNPVERSAKAPSELDRFGYQSYHLVLMIPIDCHPRKWADIAGMPETFELQIRTLFMHAWAEPQHDMGYKDQASLSDEQKRKLFWVAASAWGCDGVYDEITKNLSPKD